MPAPTHLMRQAFHSISNMARTKGAHTDSSPTRNPRPRVSFSRDLTSQAPKALAIPLFEGGVPSNSPQRIYEMRRPPTMTTSRLKSSVRRTPAKRVRTSGLGESSRPSQPDPRALIDSQLLLGMSLKAIIRRPMVIAPPIKGNLDCRARPFHSELYFDHEAMRQ